MNGIQTKAIFSAIIGTIVESYDLLLYISLLPILAPIFFPNEDVLLSRIIAMLTIPITLLMRPLGSICFGYLGDKYGRKKGIYISIILMVLPTFSIAFLPTYNQIGILAPIMLVMCRLVQGFSMGGEVAGAHTFLVEYSKPGFISFTSSLVLVSMMVGGILSTVVAYLVSLGIFNWRLAFILGALIGMIGFYIRFRINETPQFLECYKKDNLLDRPLNTLIKSNKTEILKAFILSFGAVTPFHLNFVYMTDYLKSTIKIPLSDIAILNILIQLLCIILIPVFGILADRSNKKVLMYLSLLILLLLSYPLIIYNNMFPSLLISITIQALLSLSISMYSGCFFSSSALLFPVNRRYTGAGLSLSLGVAFFSLTPSLFLLESFGQHIFSYTFFIFIFFGLLNILAIKKL